MKKYFSVDSSHIDIGGEFEDQTTEEPSKTFAKAVTVVGKLILLGLAVICLTALISRSNLFSFNEPQDDQPNDDGKAHHDYTSNVYLPNTFEDLKSAIHTSGCPAIILGDKLYEASGVIWPTAVCQDLGTRIRMTVTRGMTTKAVYTFDSTNNELRSRHGNGLGLRAAYSDYFPRASAKQDSPFIFIVQPHNWPIQRTYQPIPSFKKALSFAKNGFCPKLKLIGTDTMSHDRVVVEFEYSSCTWFTFEDKDYVQFSSSNVESGNAEGVPGWIFWVTMVSDKKAFDCARWQEPGIGYREHLNGEYFSFGRQSYSSFRCDSQSVQMLF